MPGWIDIRFTFVIVVGTADILSIKQGSLETACLYAF
jgi:hypothetical protein